MTVLQVPPDRKGQRVQMWCKARRESQDQLARKDCKVFKEQQVLKDRQEHRAWQEMMVPQVLPDRKAQRAQTVYKARRESQDQLVRKDCRAFKGQPEHKVHKAYKA